MIQFMTGDLLRADAEALVNPVNCLGVMGRGLALQFKRNYPDNFMVYKGACGRGEVRLGEMFVYETRTHRNPRFIINFPTKRHWRDNSHMGDISLGLEALVKKIGALGIASIAIPALGCGLGSLDWAQVCPRIEAAMGCLKSVNTIVFEPVGWRRKAR
jgi:O-acetyl-ADP-ribose deacetylase (regulator of RNase III)